MKIPINFCVLCAIVIKTRKKYQWEFLEKLQVLGKKVIGRKEATGGKEVIEATGGKKVIGGNRTVNIPL